MLCVHVEASWIRASCQLTYGLHGNSVLDLVAASVGSTEAAAASSGTGAFGSAAYLSTGGGAAAAPPGVVVEGGLPLPSEEPWDVGQYSGFAVEAFLSNVLGVGVGSGGGDGSKGT